MFQQEQETSATSSPDKSKDPKLELAPAQTNHEQNPFECSKITNRIGQLGSQSDLAKLKQLSNHHYKVLGPIHLECANKSIPTPETVMPKGRSDGGIEPSNVGEDGDMSTIPLQPEEK